MFQPLNSFCLVTAAVCLLAGCSNDDVDLAEVTGEVLFNGRPTLAEIVFEPALQNSRSKLGRPSTAFADKDGHFQLLYLPGQPGALIGRHRVSVKILRRQDDTEKPLNFQQATTPIKITRIIREVEPGKNHFRFAITY